MNLQLREFMALTLCAGVLAAMASCSSNDATSGWPVSGLDAGDAPEGGVAGAGGSQASGGHAGSSGLGGAAGASGEAGSSAGGAAGVGGGSSGAGGSGGDPGFTPDGCFKWPAQSLSLQQAVETHPCVEVQQGDFELSAAVHMKPGHKLRGLGPGTSVLRASQADWNFGCCDSMIADSMPSVPQDNPFVVRSLTLDGAGVATYNVCCRGLKADDLVMKNSRCSAVGIAGKGVVVTASQMLNSAQHTQVAGKGTVSCATGGYGGVDEGAAIYSQGMGDDYGSVLEGNTIQNSYGPALDVNGAWGGSFRGNIVSGNSAWAAVSLYGASHWVIENNQISHPSNEPAQPYHPKCAGGPAGAHSAGIFLCQDTDTNNLVTTYNLIRGNHSSSYYGILSIGADDVHPYWAPRHNTFDGNDVFGSNFGCADDFKPGQWMTDQNVWTGNNCQGAPNTGPVTF
jgi:parallel beta-helix repeat protein